MASSKRVDVGSCKILLVGEEPHHMYQVWRTLAPTADVQRYVGGLFTIWELNDAYNTVDTNVGAYNTVCVRVVVKHCSRRCTGYRPCTVV